MRKRSERKSRDIAIATSANAGCGWLAMRSPSTCVLRSFGLTALISVVRVASHRRSMVSHRRLYWRSPCGSARPLTVPVLARRREFAPSRSLSLTVQLVWCRGEVRSQDSERGIVTAKPRFRRLRLTHPHSSNATHQHVGCASKCTCSCHSGRMSQAGATRRTCEVTKYV